MTQRNTAGPVLFMYIKSTTCIRLRIFFAHLFLTVFVHWFLL
jgi:hypothetical protein